MQMLRAVAIAATLAMLAVPVHAATTFDFFWTGDPSSDLTIDFSGDAT